MKSKHSIHDLAINGGAPLFDRALHVGLPAIGNRSRFIERINAVLDRQWFTNNGPNVQELEQRLSDYLGVKHCLLMSNGTAALEVIIRALDLSGEVIVPALTFVATAHALKWLGLTPIFCDVDPKTHTLDPSAVEKLITPQTSAILGVHVWGQVCRVNELAAMAERHQLKLFFDAAHAFGCSSRSRFIGNFGQAEVFSFHATKFFHTLEGGAITTNDAELAERIRLMRNFGFTGQDQVNSIGINAKLNEVSAAMGLTQLENLAELLDRNKQNYFQYAAELANWPGVRLLEFDSSEQQNYQYIVLEVDVEQCGLHRDALLNILRAENVLARRYFYPGCHHMEPYRSSVPPEAWNLTVTDSLVQKILCLPTGMNITSAEISGICQLIRFALKHSSDLA